MFHEEFMKSIILGSKGQKSRSRVTKPMSVWVFALLWVLAAPLAPPLPNAALAVGPIASFLTKTDLLLARLMGQYCFAGCRLSSVVVCNAAGGRASGRSVGRHWTAGQSCYVPLGDTLLYMNTHVLMSRCFTIEHEFFVTRSRFYTLTVPRSRDRNLCVVRRLLNQSPDIE